jgi:hypothetical protein
MADKPTPFYADIADHEEDARIDIIGSTVMKHRKTVAFITDSDPGKADRYIRKLTERFPGIKILGRFNGPVLNTVSVKVGPPDAKEATSGKETRTPTKDQTPPATEAARPGGRVDP